LDVKDYFGGGAGMEPIRSPRLPELPDLVHSLLQQDPELAESLDRLNLTSAALIELTTPHLDEIMRSATPEIEQLAIAEFQLAEADRRPAVAAPRLTFLGKIRNRWLVIAGAALAVFGLELTDPDFAVLEPLRPLALYVFAFGLATLAYALVRWLVALGVRWLGAKRAKKSRGADRRPAVAARFALPPRKIRNRWLVLAGAAMLVLPGLVRSIFPVLEPLRPWGRPVVLIGLGTLVYALVRWLVALGSKSAELAREAAGVDILRNRAQAAWAALWIALVDRGLRPIILQIRSRRDTPAYTTRLHYISSRGLSDIFDPSLLEVETPGVRRIRDFLDSTPGGSIGLAGPRGTGKSTLMGSFVDGRSRRSYNRRGRAIQVSAPVEYVPRDFILHVFATLCQSVIVPPPPWVSAAPANGWSRAGDSGWRGRFVAVVLSALFVMVGVGLLLPPAFGTDVDWQIWSGVALVAVGILVLGIIVAERVADVIQFGGARPSGPSAVKPREGVSPETAMLADRCLDLIRFQQTYTSGWSGSVTAGMGGLGVQGGTTSGVARVRNTLSLPDIVSLFKEFVTAVTQAGPVIIGIDELDKITSGEGAQAFLNDIKSLFGVNQCYFLISVSEDALSSFERRGLPLRDAFDSALDDVVRVGPLDYPTSLRLIRGRVIGLSSPYSALAYCLGGGLPREIIRWTRSIVLARASVGDGMQELTRHVLGEDIERKVFASMLALPQHSSPDADVALLVLGSLVPAADPEWLLGRFEAHHEGTSTTDHSQGSSGPGNPTSVADGTHEAAVVNELFAYFYFCATVLEIFTDELGEDAFLRLTGTRGEQGGIDQLVHARQCFASSPALAANEITAFRRRWGLRCPTFE
jgi:hypothetical protein